MDTVLAGIFLVLVGFILLVKGADWFVDGAAGIAAKMHIPQLIIGLTIVAFGTSAPELDTGNCFEDQNVLNIAYALEGVMPYKNQIAKEVNNG